MPLKLTVGKGKTTRPGEAEEWTKEYFEIEILIEDPSELEVTKANLTGLIDGWLSSTLTASKSATKPPAQLPQLDPDELGRLPWKTYKRVACKPDEAGWIFRDAKGAEALADLIRKQGEGARVQIGELTFVCKFSGDEQQFIGRAPC
jgi:hypothetical protein